MNESIGNNKSSCGTGLEAGLEALLFTYGEPLTLEKAAEFLSVTKEEVAAAADNLEKVLTETNGGLMILKNNDQIQLAAKPAFGNVTQKIIEDEFKEELTPAAIETVAILAYGGPLNKAEIEYIRGINSSYILRSLSLRGLVEKKDKKYSVSFNLLKQIGLASLDELPDYSQYQELIKKFKGTASE